MYLPAILLPSWITSFNSSTLFLTWKTWALCVIFWDFKSPELPHSCISISPNMLMTYLKSTICLTVSLPHLPTVPILDYFFMMVIFYLILMSTEVWLVLCIILPLQGQTSPLLCIKSVNICLPQPLFTLLQPKGFLDTFEAPSTMALNSLLVHFIYQLTQMLIGQGT